MKTMHHLSMIAILAAAFCCGACAAQAQTETSKPILAAVQRFEGNLMAMAQAMPADKYNFAPNPDTFKPGSPEKFATVRTFAQQLTHVSGEPFRALAPYGVKPDPSVDFKSFESLTSKDDILKALQASFDYQNKVIAAITPESAFAPTGARGNTLMATLISILNDDGDHYGQMVEYLRMNGIVPPATARQNMRTMGRGSKM